MNRAAIYLVSLTIGVISGLIAFNIGLPLPWMLGPMIGATIAASSGVRIYQPAVMVSLALPVVGVMLGSRITAELLAMAPEFAVTVAMLVPFVAASAAVSFTFYRRVAGMDNVTAYYAAMPGGLNDMMILGGAAGGDERRIALAHAARILCVIGFVALFFGLILGVRSSSVSGTWLALSDIDATSAIWLLAAAILGLPLGKALRLPAPQMLGPMILSGVVHVAGWVAVAPPSVLFIAAQIILGLRIGTRFGDVPVRMIARDLALGAVSSVLMILVALASALVVARISGIDLRQAFLAFSPGGFVEMSLLALAMGQEVAYVSLAHVVRIMLVILGAPLVFRRLAGRDNDGF